MRDVHVDDVDAVVVADIVVDIVVVVVVVGSLLLFVMDFLHVLALEEPLFQGNLPVVHVGSSVVVVVE